MAKKEPGYVYILTNPNFREDWIKIGKSSRPVDVRIKELDNTSVPLPFEIFATMKTAKYNEAEKLVHRYIERFTNLRIRNNREFFNVKPEEALNIEFTIEDVIRCFALKNNTSARARVFRLLKDGLVVKVDEFVENGTTKAKYKKTGAVMI